MSSVGLRVSPLACSRIQNGRVATPRNHRKREREAQPVQGGAKPQAGRVHRPHDHVEQDDEIAPVEAEIAERREARLGDDDQDSDQRDCNAQHLPSRQPIAEQRHTGRADQHRRQRVQHRHVDGRRVLQADVLQGAEQRAADHAEKQDQLPVLADSGPVVREVRTCKRPQDERRQQPAHGRDRERRHVAGYGAAQDMIARPAQGGDGHQQICDRSR